MNEAMDRDPHLAKIRRQLAADAGGEQRV